MILKPDLEAVSKKAELAKRWESPAGVLLEPAPLTITFNEETVEEVEGMVETLTALAAEVEKDLQANLDNMIGKMYVYRAACWQVEVEMYEYKLKCTTIG